MKGDRNEHLKKELKDVASELKEVQIALKAYRERKRQNESANAEALVFVEKADKVIQRAENKEIILTEDQKNKIKNNLIKILNTLKNPKK
ncbi:MAG: hypothetical protein K8R21_08255 [Leptospira sp.]|nr:hypothetical protein [Leptospira sp.]